MVGKKYGRLTVIGFNDNTGKYICRCDCGGLHEARKQSLQNGNVRSCGCLAKEWCSTGKARRTHGLSHTRIDNIYRSMIDRCYNPNNKRYVHYGGRGISVCDEWKNDKTMFFKWANESGYESDLTIDRIDVNGGYEPTNCRWVSQRVQQQNRRNNFLIEYRGEKKTATEWERISGTKDCTIRSRIKKGWSAEEAIFGKLRG